MKLIANDYDAKSVMKILREWTEQTQTDFAEKIGYSKMTVQGYERGLRKYTFETLQKIADIYGFQITIEKK